MPLILSGSNGLSGNVGNVTKDMLPAGSVLQVVQATPGPTSVGVTGNGSNDPTLTTSNTALAFSAFITPRALTSKILIQFVSSVDGTYLNTEEWVCLFRGSSLLQTSNWYRKVSGSEPQKHALIYLDSPNSIAQVQYDFRCGSTSSQTMNFNRSNGSTGSNAWSANTNIILTEIKG